MELRNKGNWREYKLTPSERIVGVFGETFTEYSGKRLKSFGVIVESV